MFIILNKIIIYNYRDNLVNGKNESDSDSDEEGSESEGKILLL